ncbi:TPA: hypothetical protein ACFARR_002226, partial [Neisseria gonorrhoeae]
AQAPGEPVPYHPYCLRPAAFIKTVGHLSAVIPARAGIWNFNASRIYRKKPKPFRRHSHFRGNDGM